MDGLSVTENARVGEVVYFGIANLSLDGSDPLSVTGVKVLGVPSGMRVVHVAAARPDTHLRGRPGRVLGAVAEQSLRINYPLLKLLPVTDLRVPTGGVVGDWYLVVAVVATQPGTFQTSGIQIEGRRGAHDGRTTLDYRVGIHAIAEPMPPNMSAPVQLIEDCPGGSPPTSPTWEDVVRRTVAGGGGTALVTLSSTGSAVWNTPNGERPGQSQVDTGLVPAIYTPYSLTVERVMSGTLPVGPLTGLELGGTIGPDHVAACTFPDRPVPGHRYLALFGPPLPFDRAARQPVLELRRLAPVDTNGVADTVYGPVSVNAAP